MIVRWPAWASVVSTVLAQLFLVVQGILVARSLGPSARGDLGWIQWAPPLISCVAIFGMTQAIPALSGKDLQRGRPLFWSALVIALGTALIGAGAVAVAFQFGHWPLPHIVGISAWFLLSAPLEIIHSFPREYLINQRDFRSYDLLKVAQSALSCLAVLALVAFGSLTPATAAIGFLASAAVMGLLSWSKMYRVLAPPTFADRAQTRAMLRFGGLCVVAALAGVVQTRALQWKVGTLFGPDGLGLFLVAVTWGALGGPLWQVIQVRFYPALAQAPDAVARRAGFRRAMLTGCGLCAVAVAGGYVLTPFVFPLLMGEKFSGGVKLASEFAVASPFQAFGVFVGFCVRGLGMAGIALVIDYVAAIVTVVAAFVGFALKPSVHTIAWAVGIGGASAVVLGGWLGFLKTRAQLH